MRHPDSTLHFYINGNDQGVACEGVPSSVYGVIDLYGQCAQVSIVPTSSAHLLPSISEAPASSLLWMAHRFSECHGKSITLDVSRTVAVRDEGNSHGIVFSAFPLDNDQIFEVFYSI